MFKTSRVILLGFLVTVPAAISVAQRTDSSDQKAGTKTAKPALSQMSNTSPGLSLAPISKGQCSWGVALINHETDAVGHMERLDTTTASAQWPRPPAETLDSFVKTISDSMKAHEVRFMQGMLQDASIDRTKEFNRLRMDLSMEQRLLAYVLELRGCSIGRNAVKFATVTP